MADKTGAARQARMRESRRKWLELYAHGLSADGLVGAAVRGEVKLIWIKRPVTAPKRHKVIKK